MAENVSEQTRAKLEVLVKRRFPPEDKAERVAKALAALHREQPIKLSLQDWKWVAEDANLGDQS
jgi:hypothetical protein